VWLKRPLFIWSVEKALTISVVGNAIGAFSSLIAGLADRWGRANLVVYGVGITSVALVFLTAVLASLTPHHVLGVAIGAPGCNFM